MAVDTLKKFVAPSLSKSVDVHIPDFTLDLFFDGTTYNVTSGINEGVGPRYGMAPLPGHSDAEALGSGKYQGLMLYENGVSPGDGVTYFRKGIFGIFPFVMGGAKTSILTRSTYYAVAISYTAPGLINSTYFDVLLLSTQNGFGNQEQSPNIYDGLPPTTIANFRGETGYQLDLEMVQQGLTAAAKELALAALTDVGSGSFYASMTQFSISGSEIPMQWLIGEAKTLGDATHAPNIGLISLTFAGPLITLSNGTAFAQCGFPPSFNYGSFPSSQRSVQVYTLDKFGFQNVDYRLSFVPDNTIFLPNYLDGSSQTTIDLHAITATKISSGTAYANTAAALYNDGLMTCNSSHQGILSAINGKAICHLFQDWWRGQNGAMTQVVDLQNHPMEPPTISGGGYVEDGQTKASCLMNFPSFVRGTPLSSTNVVALGNANTGILRANTVYELTYAIYNKRLNFETNVGIPVKFQTGANDFIGLQLYNNHITHAPDPTISPCTPFWSQFDSTDPVCIPWPGSTSVGNFGIQNIFHMNYLEYRFYYRQEGMTEWLPALSVDAAKFWFYPYWNTMMACTGGIGATLGGAPGHFNDYSKLPIDTWKCTVMYKNRAFWLSEKSLVYSNSNCIFQYPARNSAACPSGSFKGALVHAYYGQADQDARLVVFSTKGTFVGKFTGNRLEVPVQVSTNTVANFGLDGSDFVLNPWTSVTAFSHRSAIVAEGILYFWGPQGVFMDDGVNSIQRISKPLEPDIFSYYDPNQTDAISCTYNDMTKEVCWFYSPRTADATYPTYALVWNTQKKTWLPQKMPCQVDAAQQLVINSAATGPAGTRTLLYARQNAAATTQRAYFFDHRNRAGDQFPTHELMVKTVSTPATGQRRLTLAAGGASLAGVSVGDTIVLQQCADYAGSGLAAPADFMAKVVAVNSGAKTVDILLPTGVTFDGAATITNNAHFFPIYHCQGAAAGVGLNGIPWFIQTKYWVPAGMGYWGLWLYLYLQVKYGALPSSVAAQTLSVAYRTPVSDVGYLTDLLTFANNSDGNWQVKHPLQIGNQNIEGQGLKLQLSGIQIGSTWVLQYLEAHSQQLDGDQLAIFEG